MREKGGGSKDFMHLVGVEERNRSIHLAIGMGEGEETKINALHSSG